MDSNQVRPSCQKLTGSDVQMLLSDALVTGRCHRLGPEAVAAAAGGVDEKTIRRARDRETQLKAHTLFNLLDADEHILDAILAAKGFMLMPLMAAAPDIVSAAGATLHRIGQARCPSGEGGQLETDEELVGMENEADAMLASALELRSRIVEAKLRRAA